LIFSENQSQLDEWGIQEFPERKPEVLIKAQAGSSVISYF